MKALDTLNMLLTEYRHDEDDVALIKEAIAELEALQLRLLDAESYFHGVYTVKAPKTCDGCEFEHRNPYVFPCEDCIRNNTEDYYQPKDKQ